MLEASPLRAPPGYHPTFAWDRFGDRVFEQTATTFLCQELRATLCMNRLKRLLMRRVLNAMPSSVPRVVRAVLLAAVPTARRLANVVLIVWQVEERPKMPELVRLVICVCGWIVIFDASTAAFRHCRLFGEETQFRAGLQAVGLFDVPLLPTVLVRWRGKAERARGIICIYWELRSPRLLFERAPHVSHSNSSILSLPHRLR